MYALWAYVRKMSVYFNGSIELKAIDITFGELYIFYVNTTVSEYNDTYRTVRYRGA